VTDHICDDEGDFVTAWRPRLRLALVGATAATGLVAAGLLAAPPSSADPERIAAIEAELDKLGQEQAYANEQVLTAQYEFDQINAKMDRTKNKIDDAKSDLKETQGSIGRYAAAAYRSGGIDSSLQLLLSNDPQEFLDSAVVLDIVANSQNAALRKGQVARLKLAQATAELSQQQVEAEQALTSMESYKAALDDKIAETEAYLEQLKEEERQRLEEERKRREAEQRAAAAAAAAAASSSSGSSTSGSGSSGSSSGGYSGGSGVSSDRAATAVAAALAQVGKPYVNTPPGAQPPNSWDCSKLTAWAWGQAGVGLTPYSAAQINEVRTISQSELQPGDLLFYYNPSWGRVGHVSMYIGGGMVVEASTPSTGVRIHPVYWSNFVKAGRPYG
jgi:peptidoglycan DL-endopeptidase CwlO